MEAQLLKGQFNTSDAINIISKLYDVKIDYHQSCISNSCVEEDIKMREGKIKALQNELAIIRTQLQAQNTCSLSAQINIS